MSEENQPQYLAIRNWDKFQPKLKNGKPNREWIRVDTRLEDDDSFLKLTFFERSILIGIWRIKGRTGKNPPNDVNYIRRALQLSVGESSWVGQAIFNCISNGFLVLSNQQTDEEFAPRDVTGQDKTISIDHPGKTAEPAKVKSVQKPKPKYTPQFEEFWSKYPRSNGKFKAFEEFQKINPQNGDLERIINAVETYKKTEQWNEIQYIPYAATFLHQRRFEDVEEAS